MPNDPMGQETETHTEIHPHVKLCAGCGNSNRSRAGWCSRCGERLRHAEPDPESAA
ncbi:MULTISPECIES: hypothetical protein [unclassified Streptomyces]|uniref:hypothetical protein n=1 Tax=unclassified Streptomyces TaxID=2593676 RepID=UPI000A53378D|nr:hypothetical protein [Streptomyces sp. NRRL S-87]